MFADMKLSEAQQQLLFQLYHHYSDGEAAAIADLVMESLTGWKKIDRVTNKTMVFSLQQEEKLATYIEQLGKQVPVQYVLGEAWFCGMNLFVDNSVLIPRQETEELVDWIAKDIRSGELSKKNIRVLDMGTGSGCIALGIKKFIPSAHVHGCDISESALEIARRNASTHQMDIEWHQYDILNYNPVFANAEFDIIVSNPPYIPLADAGTLPENVVKYEPHLALFAADEDPLQFYKAIAIFGLNHLQKGGRLYFEVHEDLAKEVGRVMKFSGYSNIEIRKDMQGKERMVFGESPKVRGA